MEHLSYWERLQDLWLFSFQRQQAIHIIIYVWKILEEFVPDVGLQEHNHPRRGHVCCIRRAEEASQKTQTIIHNRFTYNGAWLFNAVPPSIRNLTSVYSGQFQTSPRQVAVCDARPAPNPGLSQQELKLPHLKSQLRGAVELLLSE